MRIFRREDPPPAVVLEAAALPRGEKVLAHARDGDRWVLGTRRALILHTPGEDLIRIPWEQVQAADWDNETEQLVLAEVGEYGRVRGQYTVAPDNPDRLLQLIRERVTASVVLQRGYLVTAKQGFKVIARRPPEGGGISWMLEYDPGVDPEDPGVIAAAESALERARADVGGLG